MLNEKTLGDLYNAVDPSAALNPEDPFNVDFDAITDAAGDHVRGEAWADLLTTLVSRSNTPVFALFTGLPGSGKSTELRRLAARLLLTGQHVPVVIDAQETLDLTGPLDVADLLITIVHQVERCVLQLEGKASEQALQDSYFGRLWIWLTRTDVNIGKAELAVSEVGKFDLELKTRPTFRQKIREVVANRLSEFLASAREELQRLQDRTTRLGKGSLVVIFDSLEKLSGAFEMQREIEKSAEHVFFRGSQFLRQLPIHCLYTVPPYLLLQMPAEVQFMPMLKIRTREGQTYQPGYDAARELIRRRIPDAVLPDLFGSAAAAEEHFHTLIEASGGFPRDILRPLRDLLLVQVRALPLTKARVDRALNRLRDTLRNAILGDRYPWLARVALTKRLAFQNEEDRKVAVETLGNNIVFRYLNGQDWFDVHPLVRELEGVAELLKQASLPGP